MNGRDSFVACTNTIKLSRKIEVLQRRLFVQMWPFKLLSIPLSMTGAPAKVCPDWMTSWITDELTAHPNFPGIQLALHSAHCGLSCETSVNSNLSQYTEEPPYLVDSPWRIASITKTFTAIAMLRLVEQNKLNLHAPVVKLLPAWAFECLERQQGASNASQVTPWMLLHHTSGLGDPATDSGWIQMILENPQHQWTQKAVLAWAAANLKPVGYPGEFFRYSDTGYTYLGLLLEMVAELPLADAVRELVVLDKLNMPSTYWEILERTPENIPPRAGQYYDGTDATQFDASFDLYGAGGLVSNSADLNEFTRALHSGRILSNASLELLFTTERSGYSGCGVFNDSFAGQQAWGHRGFWKSWTYYVPSLDLTFSGTNGQGLVGLDLSHLVQKIIDNGCSPVNAGPLPHQSSLRGTVTAREL